MERQLLDPIGDLQAVAVVRRLGGVQAHVLSSAVLAVRVRQQRSSPGEVTGALADGELIKTWAMRGTLHLLDPESAGTFLSLLAAGRGWERPSWVRTFGLGPDAMERLRVAVREALDGAVLTREALFGAEVIRRPGARPRGGRVAAGGARSKPLAYQGDLCFGPSQGEPPGSARYRQSVDTLTLPRTRQRQSVDTLSLPRQVCRPPWSHHLSTRIARSVTQRDGCPTPSSISN